MSSLTEKFQKIRAIILDVDGVLTDGSLVYRIGMSGCCGKSFFARDGQWIKIALRAGFLVGLLTGRSDEVNRVRAKELGLSFVYDGCHDKAAGLEQLLKEQDLALEECLYIGDDVIDLPVMRRVGIGVAVADGVPELDEAAAFRTRLPGGCGAVMETVRRLLAEQGKMDEAMQRYRR